MGDNRKKYARRDFLKDVAAGGAIASTLGAPAAAEQGKPATNVVSEPAEKSAHSSLPKVEYPRVFTGRNLKMIAFPLGGIGTGTISLGGRGQLRDWEIFNRPDKGNELSYAFPAIWAQVGDRPPVARVLESRIQPPYERNYSGLGSDNAPGLPRLDDAHFTGAYPFARVAFADAKLPVEVRLEAFNPLVPLDIDASGWPVAILRYTIRNTDTAPAKVGIAWSIENPVGKEGGEASYREAPQLSGLYMDNPVLAGSDPFKGSLALSAIGAPEGSVSYLRGWKRGGWWNGVLTFWDDFSDDGALDSNSLPAMPVGSLAVTQNIPAHSEAAVTFLLAWHFPNRTPERCGWASPDAAFGSTVVGNAYTERFADAWDVSRRIVTELVQLESRTRAFAQAIETSTLPPAVLEAATSNLSTLRSNTCFRTADGEFHAFEGCEDHRGSCFGNCTHVWNYEQATANVFPALARSMRESEFLRNTDSNGLMGFRSYLPDGEQIWQRAAADGQMGCLIKLYRDWKFSGDTEWLSRLWPGAKRALQFAWIENGWDGDRDGVAEGVQHNTYDVEFYGPNPLCGIYYLGALRAGEELARVVGDRDSAEEYHRLFVNGSRWFDQNLFNGEYYIQKVQGRPADQIATGLRIGSGASNTLTPDFQMGDACLVDQLVGQYLAHVAGLGYLLDQENIRKALKSVYKYNYQPNLSEHDGLERTFALNDEGAVVIATYPHGKRPEIPFPYFGEVMTGFEYQLAAHMIYEGMQSEGLTVVESIRQRYDGERRNPWNEAECGHHYGRAMASWACLVAWSGFGYSAPLRELTLTPRSGGRDVRSFWSVPSGWGHFVHTSNPQQQRVEVNVVEGRLAVARVALNQSKGNPFTKVTATSNGNSLSANLVHESSRCAAVLQDEFTVTPGHSLELQLST